jgi:hypothetical protein
MSQVMSGSDRIMSDCRVEIFDPHLTRNMVGLGSDFHV